MINPIDLVSSFWTHSCNNDNAKYTCSNFNGFVSPQEVVKSLVISVLIFSFHFSNDKRSEIRIILVMKLIGAHCP